jgi:VWFA-related protein
MHHALLPVVLLVSVAVPVSLAAQERDAATDPRTQEIHVSVLDSQGAPVTGLTAGDFTVREDGTAREVLSAGPATAPLHIALLVDDSQAATHAIQPLREGLAAFVEAMTTGPVKAEIALITIGERPTSRVEYTSSTGELKRAVNRIFARQGAGAYLLEAIVEASRGLAKRETERPVILALSFEGIEYSNLYYQNVLEDLQKSGAALHVLAIGTPSGSNSDEMRNRNLVIAEGTARTGGRRDQLLAESAIPDRLRLVARELSNQYVVRYSRPDTLIPPEKVQVTVSRPDVTVRARTRVAGR